MRIVLFILIGALALTSCKSYLDPKYPYTEPLCEFTIGSQKYNADSSLVYFDTLRVDSASLAKTTSIHFFESGKDLLQINLSGRSIGNYDNDNATKIRFFNNAESNIYKSLSTKIIVWEFTKTDSLISADFSAELQDTLGKKISITKGRFNNVRY